MGHLIFIFLHLAALLFGAAGLLLTVPLHLIYASLSNGKRPQPSVTSPGTSSTDLGGDAQCPECLAKVSSLARKCRHCGSTLSPAKTAEN